MRYRHNTYTISGQTITLTGVTTVTVADVRLIVDETAMKVICSSMQKGNISCSGNVITVSSSVATLDSQHEYTIELDFGDQIATSGLAKQGTNPDATNTAIYSETINNGTLLDESVAAQLYAIIGEEEEEQS